MSTKVENVTELVTHFCTLKPKRTDRQNIIKKKNILQTEYR